MKDKKQNKAAVVVDANDTLPRSDIGRCSFTVTEIAQRNNVSVATVYRAIEAGRLKVAKIGTGARAGTRILPEWERAWIELCAADKEAA